jgi:RNA polymerase sigma factor (TIGR02999 family)
MEITELLQRVHEGEPEALNAVIPLVYDELKKLASARLRNQAHGEVLQTTALVHEAYLRMSNGRHPSYENRSHFFGIASRVMRLILVDAARAQGADKRNGAGEVPLADLPELGCQPEGTLLALNEALERLEASDPLKVQLIEMRYFGGMTAEESAAALRRSVHAVRRELRFAQAWLRKELAASGAQAV